MTEATLIGVYITLAAASLNCVLSAWKSIEWNECKSSCCQGKCFEVSDTIKIQSDHSVEK